MTGTKKQINRAEIIGGQIFQGTKFCAECDQDITAFDAGVVAYHYPTRTAHAFHQHCYFEAFDENPEALRERGYTKS